MIAMQSVTSAKSFDQSEGYSLESTVITGAAITYYVGGVAADDSNDGLSNSYPYATLEKAIV